MGMFSDFQVVGYDSMSTYKSGHIQCTHHSLGHLPSLHLALAQLYSHHHLSHNIQLCNCYYDMRHLYNEVLQVWKNLGSGSVSCNSNCCSKSAYLAKICNFDQKQDGHQSMVCKNMTKIFSVFFRVFRPKQAFLHNFQKEYIMGWTTCTGCGGF